MTPDDNALAAELALGLLENDELVAARARVLAGPAPFAGEVEDAIRAIVGRRRAAPVVYRGVAAMRDLVAEAKGSDPGDLKLAPGGLLDLDFLAQALVLAHAADHPALVGLPTPRVLAEAGRLGFLDEADVSRLRDAHRALDEMLHWGRLTVGERVDVAKLPPALAARLASAVGVGDARSLPVYLSELRTPVRRIFDALLRA